MPYFIITVFYVLFVAILIVAAVVLRYVPRLKFLSRYLLGGLLGSVPGIILSNIVLWGIVMLPVYAAKNFQIPELVNKILTVLVVIGVFVGPFAVSVAGIALGFMLGVFLVYRREKRMALVHI
jgi:hypothetical protein